MPDEFILPEQIKKMGFPGRSWPAGEMGLDGMAQYPGKDAFFNLK